MKVKISKSRLKKIIEEETDSLLRESFTTMKSRASQDIKRISRGGVILNEMWGSQEAMSPLIQFAQAFSGLGGAVSDQVVTIVNAYIENDQEAVYDVNPNALDMAMDRLRYPLRDLDADGEEVMEALDWAKRIFEQGDAEVEADARAAGDL